MTRMTGGPRTRWSLPRWVMAAVAAGAAGSLPPPVWLRRPLFDSKVESEINKWSREEMVDLFLDGICESQDVKDFIANKFPGEGECPINNAVFKLIMFKKLKGAPVTLMEKELKDSL